LQAADAFRRADGRALGDLSAASQADADTLLGNQIHETRTLAALARETGAFAASSFGAGFGGSVWALSSAADAGAFAERWRARYLAAVPSVRGVPWFVARPSPAALELQISGS
jgi:galactokinase